MDMGWRVAMLGIGVLLTVVGCFNSRSAPEPQFTSLVVHNRSSFDVDVYAVPSLLARAIRLGTVPGSGNVTFPLRRRDLQPGGFLSVQLHAIGSRGSWTSDVVPLSEDEIAVLDVNADASGDCSASMLYTTPKSENAPPRGFRGPERQSDATFSAYGMTQVPINSHLRLAMRRR